MSRKKVPWHKSSRQSWSDTTIVEWLRAQQKGFDKICRDLDPAFKERHIKDHPKPRFGVAADYIESLQSQLAERDKEIERLKAENRTLKNLGITQQEKLEAWHKSLHPQTTTNV